MGVQAVRPRAGASPAPGPFPLRSPVPVHLARKPWPGPPRAPARCSEARERSVGLGPGFPIPHRWKVSCFLRLL